MPLQNTPSAPKTSRPPCDKPFVPSHHLRAVCSDGNACLLRAGGAEPVVHSRFCRSVCARLGLRISARSLAVWIGRGRLVRGRDTALGGSGALKMIGCRSETCYPRRNSSSILGSMLPPLMMATFSFVAGSSVAVEQEAGHGHGSAGLGHGVGFALSRSHRLANLIFGHGDDLVHVAADVLEIDRADALRSQSVGDGARNFAPQGTERSFRRASWPAHRPPAPVPRRSL